jgi:alkylhydroperoxidase family enzyme
MERIEYVEDRVYTDVLKTPQKANLLRAIFNAPIWAEAFVRMVGVQMTALALPDADRELVILRMARKHRAEYVRGMHEGLARKAGLTDAQISELQEPNYKPGTFSERQLSILALVDAAGEPAQSDGPLVLKTKKFLSDQEIVELFGVIGAAFTVSCITVSLDIPLDRLPLEEMESFAEAIRP